MKKFGFTLQDVKKISKKQSKKKNYAGWFQSFGGNPLINNVFFNMAMGNNGNNAGDISGSGEADGGVGAVGAVGEDFEYDDDFYSKTLTEDTEASNEEPKDNNEDWLNKQIARLRKSKDGDFYYRAFLINRDINPYFLQKIYDANPDKSVDDLLSLAGLADKKKNKIDTKVTNKGVIGKPIKEEKSMYYDNEINENDSFIKKHLGVEEEQECDYPDKEVEDDFVDEDLTKGLFEDIDSEDPEVEVTDYTTPHTYYSEDWGEEDTSFLDDDRYEYIQSKTVTDYDGFNTDYTMYYDALNEKFIMIFGDSDLYTPDNTEPDAEFDDEDTAYEWFDNFTGIDDDDIDECIHSEVYLPSFSYKNEVTHPLAENYSGKVDDNYSYKRINESLNRKSDRIKSKFKYDDLVEGIASDTNLGAHEDPTYTDKLMKDIKALRDELDFLKNQAPREIRKGGAFDSQEEIDDAIKSTERELNRLEAKYKIITREDRQ